MAYKRKTMDSWEIWQHTECGWEHVTTELSWHRARQCIKAYRANQPEYSAQIRTKRIILHNLNEREVAGWEKEARDGRREGIDLLLAKRLQRTIKGT